MGAKDTVRRWASRIGFAFLSVAFILLIVAHFLAATNLFSLTVFILLAAAGAFYVAVSRSRFVVRFTRRMREK